MDADALFLFAQFILDLIINKFNFMFSFHPCKMLKNFQRFL